MSKPESGAPRKPKRPRGLLASRRALGNPTELEPASKKARVDNTLTQDQDEVKVQDWQDLEELFENSLDALYGSSWTSAIPLVRGVLHECARLVSVHKDPTLIYSPVDESGDNHTDKAPASAFYTIYASAWFLMSTFASNDTSLLAEDEPTEPLEFILSALAACEKGQQALDARQQPRAWDLELIWGRALVAGAQRLIDSDNAPQGTTDQDESTSAQIRAHYTGPDAPTALDRAFEHLFYAIKHRPEGLATGETEEERASKDERFARMLLETARGALAAAEGPRSQDERDEGQQNSDQGFLLSRHLNNARDLFVRVEQLPNVPPEVRTQAVIGAAQAGLAIGSAMAEALEDDEEEGKDEIESESTLRRSAIQILKEAVERLDTVRKLSSATEGKGKSQLVDEEEIKPLLQEALITLATLLPECPEQEFMYARYQAEGGVLEDENEEISDKE